MPADLPWLDTKPTRTLIAALDKAGIDFRFVGGAVRDGLLGRKVSDIDLATPAKPEDVVRAVEAAGLKAVPTGLAHGTVTAVVLHQPYEITTLRRDVETDGRHAVVAFTDDWQEDAARRDFTMNALYAARDGAITDFFGGEEDARAGRVRFIGDPRQRIGEDALRILRFFRFHAWYGRPGLDRAGLAACAELAAMIDRLSGERIRVEIFKLLSSPDPRPVWRAMLDSGVSRHAVPSADRVGALAAMIALERELGLPACPLRRLAALIGAPPVDAVVALKSRLKLSNNDADRLASFLPLARRRALVAQGFFGQALYGARPDWVRDALMLADAGTEAAGAQLKAFARFAQDWVQPRFPLTGADLQSAGIPSGPEMGRILADIESWWVAADFAPDRSACLERLPYVIATLPILRGAAEADI